MEMRSNTKSTTPRNPIPTAHQTKLITIKALNRISPWHIFQLIRKDLRNESRHEMNNWFVLGGIKDLNIITEEASIVSSLNQKINGTSFRSFQCIWNSRLDLQATFGLINSPSFSRGFRTWGKEYGLNTLDDDNQLNLEYKPSKKFKERDFGVNLFGCSEILGIGEDIRTTQAALEKYGIPTAIIDIPTKHTSKELRHKSKNYSEDLAPFAFIFCLTQRSMQESLSS